MITSELSVVENKNDLLLRLSEYPREGREILSLVLAHIGDPEIERAALEAFDAATVPVPDENDLEEILENLGNIESGVSNMAYDVRKLKLAWEKKASHA